MTPMTGASNNNIISIPDSFKTITQPANIYISQTFDPSLYSARLLDSRMWPVFVTWKCVRNFWSFWNNCHPTLGNFTRVSSEIGKTKYNFSGVKSSCQTQWCVNHKDTSYNYTQTLLYYPRFQYLKFSRFDDLFYAQFHISCIRAHLRNNYKKFSSHWAWLHYDPFNMRHPAHTSPGDTRWPNTASHWQR